MMYNQADESVELLMTGKAKELLKVIEDNGITELTETFVRGFLTAVYDIGKEDQQKTDRANEHMYGGNFIYRPYQEQ